MHSMYLKATSHSTASVGFGLPFFILVDMQNIPFGLGTPQLFITMSVCCLGALLFTYHFFLQELQSFIFMLQTPHLFWKCSATLQGGINSIRYRESSGCTHLIDIRGIT